MNLSKEFTKCADDILDYSIDWSTWLNDSDTVSAATWTVTAPSGDSDPVVVDSNTLSSNKATAVLSGGTSGEYYKVKCHITTTAGLEADGFLIIQLL